MKYFFLQLFTCICAIGFSQSDYIQDHTLADFELKGPVKSMVQTDNSSYYGSGFTQELSFEKNGFLSVTREYYNDWPESKDSTVFYYQDNLINMVSYYDNDTLSMAVKYEFNNLKNIVRIESVNYEYDLDGTKSINYSVVKSFEYNEIGKLISVKDCSKQRDRYHFKDSLLDQGCKTIENNKYIEDKIIESKTKSNITTYVHNGKFLKEKKITYKNGSYHIIELNKNGQEIKKELFDSNSVLKSTTHYIYGTKTNNLLQMERRSTANELLEYHEFDNQGNKLSEKVYEHAYDVNDDRSFLKVKSFIYEYVYDNYGNWVERNTYSSSNPNEKGELISKEIRTIEYWP
jgi:hypothetical protein